MTMAHAVFISYAHKDKATADAVCAALEEKTIRCWIAPRDVLPGKEYAAAIVDAIATSRAMVLIFSSQSNTSPQVKREVERAASKGLVIIPFRVEDVPMSKSLEYYLSDHHWLDAATGTLEESLRKLTETLQELIKEALSSAALQTVEPAQGLAPARSADQQRTSPMGAVSVAQRRPVLATLLIASGLLSVVLAALFFGVRRQKVSIPDPGPGAPGVEIAFQVRLSIPKTRFRVGDDLTLRVTSNRDAYFFIYDVFPDGAATLLVPTDAVPAVLVKAESTWEYPGEWNKRGIHLMAQLPEGKTDSDETFHVIASEIPLPREVLDPADGGYPAVLRRLKATRQSWTEDARSFTISRH